jgi:endonuclease YncB( thermonuclease family)
MQILRTWTAVMVAAIQLGAAPARSDPALVRSVVDGDTIDVAGVGRVRLLGIDAPELGFRGSTAAPFATEAKQRLVSLVLHRWVRLEYEGATRDVYNRSLAYVVTEDGVFVNAALVREGLARVTGRPPLARLSELERAQAEAQQSRRGMWGTAPVIPAAGYTRGSSSKGRPRSGRATKAAAPKRPRAKKGSAAPRPRRPRTSNTR